MERLKRRILSITAVCFSLLVLTSAAAADRKGAAEVTVDVTSGVDKLYVGIGDRITYSITVFAKEDIEVEFPAFEGEIGGLTIKEDLGPQEKKGLFGKKTFLHEYVLTSYKPGPYTIPPAIVKFRRRGEDEWREVETDEIKVAIKSALEGEKGVLDVRDIKGPVTIRGVLYFLPFVAIALVVLAAVAGAYVFARKKVEKLAAPPPKPAHVLAYEALERLNRSGLLKEGRVKEYYIGLSDIVRHYLENRFDLRAPEMTTEEFLVKARDIQELSSEDKNLLKDFMFHCDLVKFAKYGPSDTEIKASSGSAKRLIDQTKLEKTNGVER